LLPTSFVRAPHFQLLKGHSLCIFVVSPSLF
jgi:hypothetical protein